MKIIKKDGSIGETDQDVSANGTCLQGHIVVSYDRLVSIFGAPNVETDGYKTDAEWNVLTPDGIATIYNWKNGKNYLGGHGLPVEAITEWNIGGHTAKVEYWIVRVIQKESHH